MLAALYLLSITQTNGVFIPTWAGLQQPYAHSAYADKAPVSEIPVDGAANVKIRFSFKSEKGDVASGIFERPKADKRYPVVILIHGLGGSMNEFLTSMEQPLL